MWQAGVSEEPACQALPNPTTITSLTIVLTIGGDGLWNLDIETEIRKKNKYHSMTLIWNLNKHILWSHIVIPVAKEIHFIKSRSQWQWEKFICLQLAVSQEDFTVAQARLLTQWMVNGRWGCFFMHMHVSEMSALSPVTSRDSHDRDCFAYHFEPQPTQKSIVTLS